MPNADPRGIADVMAALYESISGPAGVPRDWERNDALYAPGARLMIAHPGTDGVATLAGTVDWRYQQAAALAATGTVPGVRGVNNQLRVTFG